MMACVSWQPARRRPGVGVVVSMIPPPKHDGARIVRLTPRLRLCKRKLAVNTAL